MAAARYSAYVGSFVHCKTLGTLEILHDTAVIVDPTGKIVHAGPADQALEGHPSVASGAEIDIHRVREGQFFFPGFIGQWSDFLSLSLSFSPIKDADCL